MAGKSYEINVNDFGQDGKYVIKNVTKNDSITLNYLMGQYNLEKEGNDLLVSTDKGTVVLSGYFKQKEKNALTSLNLIDGTTLSFYNSKIQVRPERENQKNINGTFLNDAIIGTSSSEVIKSGGGVSDVIISGGGNDTIYAQALENEIIFDSTDNTMGNNIVYVSKVEGNRTLLKFNGLSDTETFDFERKGNDVIIRSDIPNNKGKVTIKDYFKDSNANVLINYNSSDYVTNLDDYLNVIPELFYIDKSDAKKAQTITGTRLNERIVGSDYADKIYSNGGNDTIYAGKGNDKIYISDGYTTLEYKQGDGNDTIYYNGNENSRLDIQFSRSESEHPSLRYVKSGNDLNVFYTYDDEYKNEDKITIKNFYKNENSENINFYNFDEPETSESLYALMLGNKNKSNKLYDTVYNDFIIGGNKNDTIISNNGDDDIFGRGGNDYIKLSGDSYSCKTLEFFTGDGTDTVETSELGDMSAVNFVYNDSINRKYYVTDDGNSLIAGDFGGYKIDEKPYELKDILPDGVNTKLTFDITNSKVIFKDFFNNENNITIDAHKEIQDGVENFVSSDRAYYLNEDSHIGTYYVMSSAKNLSYIDPAALTATDNDDYIVAGNKYNNINAGKGDDIVVTNTGKSNIDMGEGTDTLVINNINKSGNTVINADKVQINGIKESDLYYFFDVDKNGNILTDYSPIESENTDNALFGLVSKNNLSQILRGGDYIGIDENEFLKTGTIFESTDIKSIDTVMNNIYIADKNGLNAELIDTKSVQRIIAKKIGEKLSEWGFETVTDLFVSDECTKKQRNEIYNIFKQRTDGNDVLTADENFKFLQGGKGNDTYNVDSALFADESVKISDTSGKDVLNITGMTADDVTYIFDVNLKTNKKGEAIIDKNGNATYKNSGDLTVGSNIDSETGLVIKDYFGKGKIETIKVNDDVIASDNDIKLKSQAVANWLYINGYNSTSEVFADDGSASEQEELSLIYNKGVISASGVIEGTDESDFIMGSGKNDTIYGNGGSDTIVGGKGNDTYIITDGQYLDSLSVIYDTAGKDTLQIGSQIEISQGDNGDEITFPEVKTLFHVGLKTNKKGDVILDKYGNAKYEIKGDLLISDTIAYTNEEKQTGIFIKDYFGKGKIESIKSCDMDILTSKDINETAQRVANWLKDNGYTSMEEIFNDGDDDIINELYSVFNGDNFIKADGSEISDTPQNDYILGTDEDTKIICGLYGDDTLSGGRGDDDYVLSNWANKDETSRDILIKDKGGVNDSINLTDMSKSDLMILFNVRKDGTFDADNQVDESYSIGEYTIIRSDDSLNFLTGDNSGSILVKGFDSIEKISDKDGAYITISDLNALKESVANWLTTNNYDDVESVFNKENNNDDIQALITEFQKLDWQTA